VVSDLGSIKNYSQRKETSEQNSSFFKQVALTYILQSILNEKLKTMQESWPFMKPVNRKQLKVYYEMIKEPMDLETVEKKISKHNYHSRYKTSTNPRIQSKLSNSFKRKYVVRLLVHSGRLLVF